MLLALAAPGPAGASELITRNATGVRLAVDRAGEALLTFRAGGRQQRVLAWGAINAIHPTTARPQVAFRLDYSGGWGVHKRAVWKGFRNACRRYDGPDLAWLVTACRAPDGSYWAVQSWQRMLPNYGGIPTPRRSVWELRLSHWRGPLPVLDIRLDWAYRRFHHLYGTFTYLGRPVHGFAATPTGNPLDTFGRNIYLDTLDSVYGSGWRRENSFLTHRLGPLLLRLLQPRRPSARRRHALPRDGDRPRRHARRDVGVAVPGRVRPLARPGRERRAARALRR
jgi:hypothetical protein